MQRPAECRLLSPSAPSHSPSCRGGWEEGWPRATGPGVRAGLRSVSGGVLDKCPSISGPQIPRCQKENEGERTASCPQPCQACRALRAGHSPPRVEKHGVPLPALSSRTEERSAAGLTGRVLMKPDIPQQNTGPAKKPSFEHAFPGGHVTSTCSFHRNSSPAVGRSVEGESEEGSPPQACRPGTGTPSTGSEPGAPPGPQELSLEPPAAGAVRWAVPGS